jgi:hypothetical protein
MKPVKKTRSPGILFAGLLALMLALIFAKSFLPDYVHFSNDGPLGEENAAWGRLPAAFTGAWSDLYDIGNTPGSWPLGVTALLRWMLGPLGFSKFYQPLALFILGLGAWTFFRQLKLSPLASALGALATILNSTFFATVCWGVGSQEIAIAMDFFALALVVANTAETPALVRWNRLALAGMAVGINVIEAADIGAIFSLFVAMFVLYKALADGGRPVLARLGRGVVMVVIVAVFAGFMATQTVVSLVSSQIQGMVGTGQDTETKAQHWSWVTMWSLPKMETLGLVVPGLFGYRMDTPSNMMNFLQDHYRGGWYWGKVGCDPSLDPYFEGGRKGPLPPGQIRFTGGQNYCGILVVLVALWAVAQSGRRQNSVFPEDQRRLIWFWTAVLIGSLLLAYGRFAPFYQLLYQVPHFSNIRSPTKFLIVFSWAIVILFAYGIHGFSRHYLETAAANSAAAAIPAKNRWPKARGFDRNWIWGCLAAFVTAVVGWLIYAAQKPNLVAYLQTVGFGEDMAGEIAAFSIGQVGWFVGFLALAIGLCLLVLNGVFAGKRARLGGILLGGLLVADLGRANLPYVVHWDYKQKYASNPIIDFLRDKPYEHRVAYGLPWPFSTPSPFGIFEQLYKIEWMQHQFPYYNVQSLDVVQRPRMATDLAAFEGAFRIGFRQDSSGQFGMDPTTFPRLTRLWELTDTRYLLGPAALVDLFNEQFDPAQHRFRIVQRFNVTLKPGVLDFHQKLEELTTVPANDGNYALVEFTGALPRAKLYSHWLVSTNDQATLQTLTNAGFNLQQTVLVSSALPVAPAPEATPANSGTVEYKSYATRNIVFDTKADTPTVLLLNDKHDPNWQVRVDGNPAELLRCNFIMRGVYLAPGAHTVEFRFSLPTRPLLITIMAIGVALLLCGCLFLSTRRSR